MHAIFSNTDKLITGKKASLHKAIHFLLPAETRTFNKC